MSLILENIAKKVALTPQEEALFLSKTSVHFFKNKTMLLNAGEVCRHSYFVNSGVLRNFTIKDNILEHVLGFATQSWWIGDMYSLLTQQPATLFIQALEDTEVVMLSRENQMLLFEEIPKLERFFRILTEKSLVAHQERLLDNLRLTAEERFEKFCKKHPDLVHTIAQKHIASYLGVTPEFFSKMKAKMLRK